MKSMGVWLAALATVLLGAPSDARASVIVVSIGNTTSPFVNGTTVLPATFTLNQTGPAPFNGPCGADGGANGSTNCDASWTFTYVIPAPDVVTSGSVEFGIDDIDSRAPGTQVALFQLNGGDNLTAPLNVLSEGLNGGTGSVNREYDEFTLALTPSSLAQLNLSTATFHLTLKASGLGVLGQTPSNGGFLLFSTLTLQTEPNPNGGPTVPEPATLLLLAPGLAAAVRSRMKRKTMGDE